MSGVDVGLKTITSTLSTGQHKRIIIALGIYLDFDAYLWDETFSNIDVAARNELLSHLKGKTNIFITHEKDLIDQNCDRVLNI